MTLILLTGAVLAALPRSGSKPAKIGLLLAALILAAAMIGFRSPTVQTAGVVAVLAAIAVLRPPPGRTAVLLAAEAAFVLLVYRTACNCFPVFWQSANALGGFLGGIVGTAVGQPLSIARTSPASMSCCRCSTWRSPRRCGSAVGNVTRVIPPRRRFP